MASGSQDERSRYAPGCQLSAWNRGNTALLNSPYREMRTLFLLVVAFGTTFAVEMLGRLFWGEPRGVSEPPGKVAKKQPAKEEKKMKAKPNDASAVAKRVEDDNAEPFSALEAPFAESTGKPRPPKYTNFLQFPRDFTPFFSLI